MGSTDQASIAAEAAWDGIYVIRTNVSGETLGSREVVEAYKQLSEAEKAPDALLAAVGHHHSGHPLLPAPGELSPDRGTAHERIAKGSAVYRATE